MLYVNHENAVAAGWRPFFPVGEQPVGTILIDRTGSWTLPFAGSIGLLLLGAGLAFRMHPDRPFEPRVAAPVAA